MKTSKLVSWLCSTATILGIAGSTQYGCYPHQSGIKGMENDEWGKGQFLECPLPRKIEFLPENDPASSLVNGLQLQLYDQETSYYQRCAQDVSSGKPIPPRPETIKVTENFVNFLQEVQLEYGKEQAKIAEANAHERQAEAEIKKAENRPSAYVSNNHILQNSSGGIGGTLSSEGYSVLQKVVQGAQIAGLSVEEQKAICDGNTGSKQGRLIGIVNFENCISTPAHSTSRGGIELLSNIETALKENHGSYTLLFCGNSSEPIASKCSISIRDYGNGQLSWDRGFSTAVYTYKSKKEFVADANMAVYASSASLNERSVKVYLVK